MINAVMTLTPYSKRDVPLCPYMGAQTSHHSTDELRIATVYHITGRAAQPLTQIKPSTRELSFGYRSSNSAHSQIQN